MTSAGSGVGRAIADAARLSPHRYRILGMDCAAAGSAAVRVPPTDRGADFRSAVLTVARGAGKCLILPGRDPDIEPLLAAAKALTDCGAIFPSGPAEAVMATLDKACTADALGLDRFFACTATTTPGALVIAERTGWPLIVKPRRGSASRGIRVARCASELADLLTEQDVAQEFLPLLETDRRPWDGGTVGGQDGEYSLQLVLGPDSEFLGSFAGRHSLAGGRPVLVEVLDPAAAAPAMEVLVRGLQAIGASGCWNFQGKMSPRGIRYFEVNGRTTGITGLRASLGFNEVDLLYEAFVLGRIPARQPGVLPGLVDASDWTAPVRM